MQQPYYQGQYNYGQQQMPQMQTQQQYQIPTQQMNQQCQCTQQQA